MELFLLLLVLVFHCSGQLIVILSNRSINAITTYQLTIIRTPNTLNPTGQLTISFPMLYFTTTQLSSATCTLPCIPSGNTITINNAAIPAPLTQIAFNISNIANPGSVVSPTLTASFNTSETYSANLGIMTPGKLLSCSVVFNPNLVNTVGAAVFNILPTNNLASGSVEIILPSQWNNTVGTISPFNSTFSCLNGGGTNVSCSYVAIPPPGYLTISNITLSSVSGGNFTVSTFLSPPVSTQYSGISVSTRDSSTGGTVDSYTSCTIQAPQPKTLAISGISGASVNQPFTSQFVFPALDPITVGDVIEFSVNNSLVLVKSAGSMNLSSQTTTLTLTTSNTNSPYAYTISSSNSSFVINAGSSVTLSGLNFTSPPFSGTLQMLFYIRLLRNGYCFATGTASLTTTPGALAGLSISSNETRVQKSSLYSLSFTTSNAITPTGGAIIVVPSSFTGVSCVSSGVVSVNGSATGTGSCTSSGNTLTILQLKNTQLPSNSVVTIIFVGNNPATTKPTDPFQVSTLYNTSTNTVDQGSGMVYTATVVPVNCVVVPSNFALAGVGNYVFTYTTSSLLPSGSQIVVTLPPQVSTTINTSGTIKLNNSVVTGANVVISGQKITVSNVTSGNIPLGSVVTVNVSTVVNPSTFSPTYPFTFASYLNSYLIEQNTTGMIAQMTLPSTFQSCQIVPASAINGQTAPITIRLNSSIDISSGFLLQITLPSSVSFSSPSCNGSMVCTLSGTTLSIKFTQPQTAGILVAIEVNGFTNSRTYDATGPFQFALYNTDNKVVETGNYSGFSNSQPNFIKNLTMLVTSPSQSYLNSTQTVQFSVVTQNKVDLSAGEYFVLTYPSVYSSANATCANAYSCAYNQSNNSTKISGLSSPTNTFTFLISNLISPSTNNSLSPIQYFTLSSFDSKNNPIDATNTTNPSTSVYFKASCNISCQTCSTSNPNYCLSCYPNGTLLNGICMTECIDGYYKNPSTGKCLQCLATCLTCTNGTSCTSCNQTGTFPFLNQADGTCLSKCPPKFYGSSSQNYTCQPCSSLCNECDTSASNCTSCNPPLLLHINSCVNQCPSNTTNVSLVCQQCSPSCNGCINSTTTCVSCAPSYFWRSLNSSECVSACDNGLVLFNGVCQCYSQCLTCQGTYTTCTSCNTSTPYKYLYNNNCLSQCPVGTYTNVNTCVPCMDGCQICTATQCLDDLNSIFSVKLIPVPFTIAAIVVGIIAILSKVVCTETFIPGFLVAIGGVLQVISWMVLMGIMRYYDLNVYRNTGLIFLGCSIGVNYLLNIANIVVFCKYLLADKSFSYWYRRQSSKINNRFTLFISGILNHRYTHILFCKAFNSQSLRGPLDLPRNIVPVYIVTGVGFLAELLAISGCAVIAYDPRIQSRSQLFMQCIDVITLNILMLIFVCWNFVKPEGFFKPFEISRYEDKEEFKNNETIEDLRDKYLENMEIEEVAGGFGKPRYSTTRLHMEGLEEKVLKRSRHRVDSSSLTKNSIAPEDGDPSLEYRLMSKMMKTEEGHQLEGISESNNELSESLVGGDESKDQLQPSNKKQQLKRTNFEAENANANADQEKVDVDVEQKSISISSDSLVRYEGVDEFEEAEVIFTSNQPVTKPSLSTSKVLLKETQETSPLHQNKGSPSKHSSVIDQNQEKQPIQDDSNKQKQWESDQAPNENENDNSKSNTFNQQNHSDDSFGNSPAGSTRPKRGNYVYDQQPQMPTFMDLRQSLMENSLSAINQTNSLDNFNSNQIPSETQYIDNDSQVHTDTLNNLHRITSRNESDEALPGAKRGIKALNHTVGEFRKLRIGDSEEEGLTGLVSHPGNLTNALVKTSDKLTSKTPTHSLELGLPHHKFQRYFQEEADSYFEDQNNQLPQANSTTSSVGRIRKLNSSLNQFHKGIQRDVVTQHILAPQTPIRMPRMPPTAPNSMAEPLSVISQHQAPSLSGIQIQNPVMSQKLKSLEKIYLQKIEVSKKKRD